MGGVGEKEKWERERKKKGGREEKWKKESARLLPDDGGRERERGMGWFSI